MKPKFLTLSIIVLLSSIAVANAQITASYQPTPYPDSLDSSIHHIVDGWITNIFYDKKFQRDDKLQVGGWGDIYHSYIKFDLTGLPVVTKAELWLKDYPRSDGSTLTPFAFCKIAGSWDPSMVWSTQPGLGTCMNFNSGPENYWWIFDITSQYQAGQSGPTNNGIMMYPLANDNRFNVFRSSRVFLNRAERPLLKLTFTQPVSTPAFKMPLPGNIAWLVTTEPGGWDCKGGIKGEKDDAHAGSDYFSIDFSWKNISTSNLSQVYAQTDDIPVLAAASGTVAENAGGLSHPNGYYIVLQHASGFSTRYLHLKQAPSIPVGQTVAQGDQIGIMGTTGRDANGNPTSTGIHVHFGVRYSGSGSSNQAPLRAALLDGRLFKSYQTECQDNLASTGPILYYPSSNRVYR